MLADWSLDYRFITCAIQLGNLDPKDEFYELRGSPVEELDEVQFSSDEPGKTFKIGKLLCKPLRTKLIEFLRKHKDNFAWTHHDIPGIDPKTKPVK